MWFESDSTEQLSHTVTCANSTSTAVSCFFIGDTGPVPPHRSGPVTQAALKLQQTVPCTGREGTARPSWGIFQVSLPLTLGCMCDALNDCAHKAVPVDVCVTNCAHLCGMGFYSPCLCPLSGREQPCKELSVPCQPGPRLWVRHWSPSLCPHRVELEAVAAACLVPDED